MNGTSESSNEEQKHEVGIQDAAVQQNGVKSSDREPSSSEITDQVDGAGAVLRKREISAMIEQEPGTSGL